MNKVLAVAFILFCLEIGMFLILVPWFQVWDNNSLLNYVPFLRPIILSNFFRGAVSGLGAIDILFGLHELRLFFRSFRAPNRLA